MPNAENLKGEQGGAILGSTTKVFTASTPKDYLLGFLVIEATILTSLTMPDVADSDDLVGVELQAGSFIPFPIAAITVASGLIAGLNH